MSEFNEKRYDVMQYRRCGRTGLQLPAISLGMWNNFGAQSDPENLRAMVRTAFDLGITHFDLANNYGPPPGAAEENFAKILHSDLAQHRDELIISTKAGFRMWPGPYGDFGSKKYLIASLNQSLKRLKLDYVDIFYHHRPDTGTPLDETLEALDIIVRQGKALYAGVSSYPGAYFVRAAETVRRHNWTPIAIHQPLYNMLNRWVEPDLLTQTAEYGCGVIAFCPLAQGLLTNRYLDPAQPLPKDSRAANPDNPFLNEESVKQTVERVRKLNEIARERGQNMAQLALAWVLRDTRVTSALIGASRPSQITDCVGALGNIQFSDDELKRIDQVLA